MIKKEHDFGVEKGPKQADIFYHLINENAKLCLENSKLKEEIEQLIEELKKVKEEKYWEAFDKGYFAAKTKYENSFLFEDIQEFEKNAERNVNDDFRHGWNMSRILKKELGTL